MRLSFFFFFFFPLSSASPSIHPASQPASQPRGICDTSSGCGGFLFSSPAHHTMLSFADRTTPHAFVLLFCTVQYSYAGQDKIRQPNRQAYFECETSCIHLKSQTTLTLHRRAEGRGRARSIHQMGFAYCSSETDRCALPSLDSSSILLASMVALRMVFTPLKLIVNVDSVQYCTVAAVLVLPSKVHQIEHLTS